MLKVNNTEVTDVVYNGVTIDKIIHNGVTVWEYKPPISMFNFTGIDANGNLETELAFNGTVIEYAIGKPTYIYFRYDLVIPTPTEASDYNNKYVYDENTNEYVIYSSSLSWVVIGTTLCYTQANENFDSQFNTTGTNYRFNYRSLPYNNGLNSDFFGGFDFTTTYSYSTDAPNLNIETIMIPETYRGCPVTRILGYAFYAYYPGDAGTNPYYYATSQIKHFTLGTNVKVLDSYAIIYICAINTYLNNLNTFNFNNNLQSLNSRSLDHVYNYSKHNQSCVIRLPASVTSLNAQTFGAFTLTNDAVYIYKLIISSPQIECVTAVSYGIADACDYVVFERTVQNLSGTLQYTAATDSYYKNIVFKHLQNDQITINVAKNKSAVACTIYTDCDAVKNYDWASQNYTVTFKPLSEYEGD